MGAACCVALKDRTIANGPSNEVLHGNVRYSPSWSFRWDNRGRVAGEDTAMNWFSDGTSRNTGIDIKSASTVDAASEDESVFNSSQALTWQKSPTSETNTERLPLEDQSTSRKSLVEEKDLVQSIANLDPSPMKLSPSVNSISSFSTSPLSSRDHLFPGSSTPSRWTRRSPGHQLLRKVSNSPIPDHKSPNFSISEEASFLLSGWSNELNKGSSGGSSDSSSIPAFTELSHREGWSIDSDPLGFHQEKIAQSSSKLSSSQQLDVQTCGVCSKLVSEKSIWGGQKIIATSELAVIAVLICGHVYHADCLENMTPESNKYDPVCPVCTFGEKKTLKLSAKALKVELDSRSRKKRSRKHMVISDQDYDLSMFDHQKSNDRYEEKDISLLSSSSTKGKPFLKRHFSFGSKGNRYLSEHHSVAATRKKGFFWSKSTKQ